jgi:ornithine carbamoyltransferase
MARSMKGRCLISSADLTAEEYQMMFEMTADLKRRVKIGEGHTHILRGRTLAMIFEKPSARTRVSFEVGMAQLGGHALYLSPNDIGMGKRESTADIARVFGRMCDGIMARVFEHEKVVELAQYAGVPVINGLSNDEHPCQALADLFTLHEQRGDLRGLHLAYVGDGNNVAASLLLTCATLGVNMTVIHPEGYDVEIKKVEATARQLAAANKASLTFSSDPQAVRDADVIYTDVWASMGQEAEAAERARIFMPYQVNRELVDKADRNVLVMHCLPAHRGSEITAEVIDGPHSVVFAEAENRLHAQKALLALFIANGQ